MISLAIISIGHILDRCLHSIRALLSLVHMRSDYAVEASEIVLHDWNEHNYALCFSLNMFQEFH